MQLSRLEIKGFKSFGDQAIVNFDKGVTGIVGPNGCGKSNVVDSIRWVLGEQKTRALRSDKMENIIFNGTKKRKPAPMAQVSLTFDNNKKLIPSEYTKVTITRRYYRTGESEYLINDVRCRLKDINDLFLDTGIGSDSYAIIELKKVDEILNDKYQARRDLFEKAAGISKFKTRKKESLNKLDAVDKDLARVGDLLFEIEKNLRSLERQAKQAERYFKLEASYKLTSLAYARKTVKRQREVKESLQAQIERENRKRQEYAQAIQNIEGLRENKKIQLDHLEKNLSFKQKQLNEHIAQIRQIENDKKLKNERVRFLEDKISNLRQQIQQDIQNQSRIKEEVSQLHIQLDSANKQYNEAEIELNQLQSNYEQQKQTCAEIQQQVKSKDEIYLSKQGDLNQMNRNYEIKETRLSSSKQELEQIVQANNRLRDEFHSYELELEKASGALDVAKNELAHLQEEENQKAQAILQLENEIDEIRSQYDRQRRHRDAKANEYKLIKSLVDNMEGFPEAIKFLKKNTDWANNIPLVPDIISCDEKYRLPIENFLDPWINYYVVRDESEAFEAIRLLKEAEKGKANFFVLSTLSQYLDPEKEGALANDTSLFFGGINPVDIQTEQEENLIRALSIVHFDPEHRPLVHYLFDNLYLVKDIDQIKANNDPGKSFVSLDGEVIQRKYSISGGSVGSFEGKRLGRVKQLEQLAKEIQELEEQIQEQKEVLSQKQDDLRALKNNQELKQAFEEASRYLSQINEKYVSLRSKKEQLSQIIQNNRDRREDVQQRVNELQDQIEDMSPNLQEENEELDYLSDEIADLRDQLEIENEKLRQQSTSYNDLKIRYHQLQNMADSLEQKIDYQEKAQDDLKRRLVELGDNLQTAEADFEKLLESQENFDDELIGLQSQSQDYELNVQAAEQSYYALRGEISDMEKDVKNQQNLKEQQDGLLQELQNKAHETSLSLNSIQERLSVEFHIQLDELFKEPEAEQNSLEESEGEEEEKAPRKEKKNKLNLEEMTEEELKSEAESLKGKMERIGNINPMAMEAYQEMKERSDFITKQKDDLMESKQSLLKTINEMEDYARNAFMEAYEQIRSNFTRVFRSLFSSEDRADLVLADPENPLESRIDIVAQPKGKRPLTIDQLSGGEKTLTAISLLFALYLLKPAPFCIFDEVDAPLDDANTDKFNRIIKEFSQDSQFILVTHNKRTMASTDIMYGVTMMEDGVSSVVPVDLRSTQMMEEA